MRGEKIEESKIRELCASRPEDGFRMLMNCYQKPLYGYIRQMVIAHEDAEDILQEVFIRIFRHLDSFRNEASLSTWVYRIATNECLRFLRKRREQTASTEEMRDELTEKLMASDYVDYEQEMAVKFQQAILTLSEKQRMVFNLRYYNELEYEAIAHITGIKVETLKVRYHYAKEKIKEYMTNH